MTANYIARDISSSDIFQTRCGREKAAICPGLAPAQRPAQGEERAVDAAVLPFRRRTNLA
jgi:hypothetical protein